YRDSPKSPCGITGERHALPLAGFGRPGSSRPLARYGVALEGDHAFVAAGDLLIYRLNGRSSAVREGTLVTPGEANAVAVAGSYAYVADGDSGLRVVDIHDKQHPLEVGSVALPNWAEDVVLDGRYAYVAAGGAGIRVVDITQPQAPKEVSFSHVGRWAQDLAMVGHFVYVADDTAGLGIHDLSSTDSPDEVNRLKFDSAITCVAASGTKVFASEEKYGRVHILDARDPANPREIGILTTGGWMSEVAALVAEENLLFAADLESGIRIFDVSNAASPVEVGYRMGTYSPLALALDGEAGLVFDGGGELHVFKASGWVGLESAGTYETWTQIGDLKAESNRLYVANRREGLRVLDVKDPVHPRQIARYLYDDTADRVVISGKRAFVSLASTGISVLSLDDEARPVEIGGYKNYGGFRAMAVQGTRMYGTTGRGLVILDAANQAGMFEAGYYNGRSQTVPLVVSGPHILLGEGFFGLTVLDASDPVDPKVIWRGVTWGRVTDVHLSGKLALVSCDRGFVILDAQDPQNPQPVSRIPQRIEMAAVSGDLMFGIVDYSWLATFDISDPSRPFEIERRLLPDRAVALTASGDRLYVADEGGRITMFHIVHGDSKSDGQ
ncbi:MAG: LVIVD repeat-containing protein, partial [bacterium]